MEPEHLVTQVLMDRGHDILRLHYRECNYGPGRQMPTRLRAGEFKGLCVIFQRRKLKDVPADKVNRFVNEMCIWIRHATEVGLPVYVMGITGPHWENTQWDKLVEAGVLHVSKHRFCGIGLKINKDDDRPSNVCVKVLSTKKVASTPCRCGVPFKEHQRDWDRMSRDPEHRFHSAVFGEFCCILADRGDLCFPTQALIQRSAPDSRDVSTVAAAIVEEHVVAEATNESIANKDSSRTDTLERAFPTDERVEWKKRRKENKEKGIAVKKKVKVVEDHHDDCGTDVSGLGPEEPDEVHLAEADTDSDNSDEELTSNMSVWWLKGSDWNSDEITPFSPLTQEMCDVFHMCDKIDTWKSGVDLVEICGGEGRVSTLAVRRHCQVGENFDLVTNWDLNDPLQQKRVLAYFARHKPLVAIMGPTCKPFGRLANYNYWHNYEGWLKSYREAAPHGRFCGEIALLQERNARYFLCEQPAHSWLFAEQPWPLVLAQPTTVQIEIDQCMLGLKTKEGLRAKKPTVLVSNTSLLLEPFHGCRCNGKHEHGHLIGGRAAAAQVWTWDFASRIVEGVVRLRRHLRKFWYENAFPTVGSGPGDPDAPVPERYKYKCDACRNNFSMYDERHTRRPGECRRSHIRPIIYKCPGCKAFKPVGHGSHTFDPDECKWSTTMSRRSHVRRGRHPRHGRTAATDDETRDLQAQLPDGTDLGQHDEESTSAPSGAGGSSSSKAAPDPNAAAEEETGEPRTSVQTRAEHTRHRRKFAEANEGTENRSDWSRFEIGSVLRTLKLAQNRATIQRELRKLHLRWWHAPKTSMTRVLAAAGLPNDVLELVPDIVDTCRECRRWQKPKEDTIATIKMSTKFNEHVEMGLMFYKNFIVCHFIDRATRWHAATMVESKEDTTLVQALLTCWVGTHGPMTELIVDGERGVGNSHTFTNELKARGIKLHIRAPNQHARYIERRGALLRHALHVIEDQLKREGTRVSFPLYWPRPSSQVIVLRMLEE